MRAGGTYSARSWKKFLRWRKKEKCVQAFPHRWLALIDRRNDYNEDFPRFLSFGFEFPSKPAWLWFLLQIAKILSTGGWKHLFGGCWNKIFDWGRWEDVFPILEELFQAFPPNWQARTDNLWSLSQIEEILSLGTAGTYSVEVEKISSKKEERRSFSNAGTAQTEKRTWQIRI